MWMFITIAHGADADEVDEVLGACQKYVNVDGGTDSSMNVLVWDGQRQGYWRQQYHLPFTPIAQIYTTGPSANGSVERKQTYYLVRNDKGQIVRKLVSPEIVRSTNGTSIPANRKADDPVRDSGGVAKRKAAAKGTRRGRP